MSKYYGVPPQRSAFKMAKRMAKNAGMANAVISPHNLKAAVPLDPSKNTYLFDFKRRNRGLPFERFLDDNDLFICPSIAFALAKVVVGEEGRTEFHSYPNPTVFAGHKDLEAIYNGGLRVEIGTTVNIEGYDMQNFRYVPEFQETAPAANRTQFNLEEVSHTPGPVLFLSGDASYEIKVDMSTFSGIDFQAGDTDIVHLVMFMNGFLVKNGSARAAKFTNWGIN